MGSELGPSCFGAMPSSQPSSPSHRNPLALLSKLKRQLSKTPSPQHRRRRQQPIEHQYFPIPTVSFSESLHSPSAYSCSNNSSTSSFVFIDHNEEPASFGADEYRPFLPLIIQHERLQQRLAAAAAVRPPLLHTQRQRAPPNEPPSPTSTTSSKSPITPIFVFGTDDDEAVDVDEIMTLSSSEVGSVSEYSLPSSLSAYMAEGRSRRKSSYEASVSSRQRRVRGMAVRTPPLHASQQGLLHRHTSKKSTHPAPSSPPPSCPLPDPPVSDATAGADVRPDSGVFTMDAPLVMSDSSSGSSQIPGFAKKPVLVSSTSGSQSRGRAKSFSGLRKELAASAPLPAICETQTKASTSILSDLEISTSSISDSTSSSDNELSKLNRNGNDGDEPEDDPGKEQADVDASTPTPSTPRQYGVGRQVVRGSGSDFQCDLEDLDVASKRNSKRSSKRSSKRESGHSSVPESTPESSAPDSTLEAEDGEPSSIPVDDDVRLDLDLEDQEECTTPTPSNNNPRRRVKSDEPSNTDGSRRSHSEKPRERTSLEWTLFLGVPRNTPPPVPTAVNPGSAPSLSVPLAAEPNPSHAARSTPAPITAHPTTENSQNQHQTLLPTHLPPTKTTTASTTRNRTRSDSALLASAASASGSNTKPNSGKAKAKTKSKSKRTSGGEDWTLSLPLVTPPLPPFPPVSSSSTSAFREGGRWSTYPEASSLVLGSRFMQVEECERGADGEENGLVITIEDVDRQQGQRQRGLRRSGGEYEDEMRDDDGEENENEEALILRVPRIVRSCSASPLHSTSIHTNANAHSRTKKGSLRWMGATSTPNLRNREGGVLSSTLEEEVMCMLLGKTDHDSGLSEEDESKPKLKKSRKDLATAMLLAQKKIATLDEDLARFNALLRSGSRPSSTVIETVVAAAAVPATKTKTVTLNSCPIPASTSTPPKSNVGSQTLSIKPVLKHAKSCEPFLESSSATVVHPPFPPSPPRMGPVMRFPSSTGRGDLNFFDELGGGDGRPHRLGPSLANLRLTKSAEWRMSREVDDDSKLFSINTSIPPLPTTSRASPPPPSTRKSSTTSLNLTSSTQTLLLPFASTGVRRGISMSSAVGALRPSSAPDGSSSGVHKSKNEKRQCQKPGTPRLPRLHTSSFSSSSSSSSSLRHTDRRSISPPLQPPSPIPSESSSALPTPLASAFPLPPSSLGIAFQQKLREFESAREKHLQQQQQQRNQYRTYRPPSTASSVSSLVSNASSTATIVPSGDQKLRVRPSELLGSGDDFSNSDGVAAVVVSLAGVQENERYSTLEDDEDSMCSGTYYSARSSFSC